MTKPVLVKKGNEMANRREAGEAGYAPQICGVCGGTTHEGCLHPAHQGMDINACPNFRPLV